MQRLEARRLEGNKEEKRKTLCTLNVDFGLSFLAVRAITAFSAYSAGISQDGSELQNYREESACLLIVLRH